MKGKLQPAAALGCRLSRAHLRRRDDAPRDRRAIANRHFVRRRCETALCGERRGPSPGLGLDPSLVHAGASAAQLRLGVQWLQGPDQDPCPFGAARLPSECGRMRPTLRGESTEQSAARSCGLRLRRVERAVCARVRSCPWEGKGTTLYSTTSLPRLYHPSTTSLPSLYHLSTIPLPRLYHPSHVSLEPLTLSRGGSPESFKRKAVGIQTNPTCALYASALPAKLPLRNLSMSIAMPYAQQAHSCCHSVTSRPSFSLSQFHRHTAAARGCVSE